MFKPRDSKFFDYSRSPTFRMASDARTADGEHNFKLRYADKSHLDGFVAQDVVEIGEYQVPCCLVLTIA